MMENNENNGNNKYGIMQTIGVAILIAGSISFLFGAFSYFKGQIDLYRLISGITLLIAGSILCIVAGKKLDK